MVLGPGDEAPVSTILYLIPQMQMQMHVCYRVNRHYITSKKSFVDLIGDFPFYLSYNSSDVSLENLALDQLIIFS